MRLRSGPLAGPEPAAKTTISAPAIAASTSCSRFSRSQITGSAPVALTVSAWRSERIRPRTRSPRCASSCSSISAIWPLPPAITTSTVVQSYAARTSGSLSRGPLGKMRAASTPIQSSSSVA